MIGVICKKCERAIVEEFFQLFKTPWEFYIENVIYNVILSTKDISFEVYPKLMILFSSEEMQFDNIRDIKTCGGLKDLFIKYETSDIPIYGDILTFSGIDKTDVRIICDGNIVGMKIGDRRQSIIRIGFDLFLEVAFLLSKGQPAKYATISTLELHITMLRDWILEAGIPIIEIPPVPMGYDFITCLTHDVDSFGIRQHKCDHTMWGFLYRASFGSLIQYIKGKINLTRMLLNWKAVLLLPFVHLNLSRDFWLTFTRLIEIEKNLKSTFYIIPFKETPGDNAQADNWNWRATKYDITDIKDVVHQLTEMGFEIGVHGIDAWHDYKKACIELKRIADFIGEPDVGVRIHWLCQDQHTPEILDQAGFNYDSTFGYNDTVGFRAGTAQVFRPLGTENLLELPIHIQDMALFANSRMDLEDKNATVICDRLMDNISKHGGVMTILWHPRSLAPERLWEDFYIYIIDELKARKAWFVTAIQAVEWFRQRRSLSFKNVHHEGEKLKLYIAYTGDESNLRFNIRVHLPSFEIEDSCHSNESQIDIPITVNKEIEIPIGT